MPDCIEECILFRLPMFHMKHFCVSQTCLFNKSQHIIRNHVKISILGRITHYFKQNDCIFYSPHERYVLSEEIICIVSHETFQIAVKNAVLHIVLKIKAFSHN